MRNLIYNMTKPHYELDSRLVRNLIYNVATQHYELDSCHRRHLIIIPWKIWIV